MPQLEFEFNPKEAELIRAFLKINQKFSETGDKAGQFKRQMKEGESAFKDLGSEVKNTIGGMAAGMVGIGTAIEGLKTLWSDWQRQIETTGETMKRFTDELLKATTGRGDAYGVVRPELLEIAKRQGLRREEVTRAYEAVGGAMPLETDPAQVLAITNAAAYAKRIGLDPAQTGQMAALIGRHAMPGAAPEQLASVAGAAQQLLGSQAGRLTSPEMFRTLGQMAQVGIQGPEALKMLTGAVYAGESGEIFNQVIGLAQLTQTERGKQQLMMPPLARGDVETPEQVRRRELRRRYAQMTPEEFTRNLLSDQEAQAEFMGPQAARLAGIAQGIQEVGPRFEEALEKDVLQSTWQEVSQYREVQRGWQLERLESVKSLAPLMAGKAGERRAELDLWTKQEETRLDVLVEKGIISPTQARIEKQSLRAGLALGLYEGELPAEVQKRREAVNVTPLELGPMYLDEEPTGARGAEATELQRQSARAARNLKEVNTQIERNRDEAKAVDVGERE